ncbi:MAG TPA: flagellar assembly peptidoglycan hydrolase FlgJ [Spongiibacteraceae bacterium]
MIGKDATAVLNQPQVYTDLSSLQQLKLQGHTDKSAALKNIAHQFESMMVQMMMKSMRQANEVFSDGDITSSSDEKFYQDMFDNQLSLTLSQGRGFGIADAFMRQLQGRFGDAAKNAATPNVDHDLGENINDSLSDVRRVQTLVASSPSADSPRMIEAIQDVLRKLFDGSADDSETTNSTAGTELDGTPAAFVESLRPLAERIATSLGVDSRVLLSQSALETGWGQKVLQCADGTSSFNFFNIKADAGWNGAVVKVPTIEYQDGVAVRAWASFRAYGSAEESFADYAQLIAGNPRYQPALQCADNPRAYVKALAAAGYATDPRYADKVLALYDSEHWHDAGGEQR